MTHIHNVRDGSEYATVSDMWWTNGEWSLVLQKK